MNWDRVEGNWKKLSGKVREQWGKLTDDDLDVIEGRRETLSGRIQEIYGRSRAPDQALRRIASGRSFEQGIQRRRQPLRDGAELVP